jgi:hypothetical protein
MVELLSFLKPILSRWCSMDSPLFLPVHLSPEMSEGDRILEIELMIQRQTAIYQAIDRGLSASDLLDLVEAQDIPVDAWIDDIEEFGGNGFL